MLTNEDPINLLQRNFLVLLNMTQKTKKTVLIIGGSRGIGKAIAMRMANSGWDIWLTYQSNHKAAEETKKAIEELGVSCRLFAFPDSEA